MHEAQYELLAAMGDAALLRAPGGAVIWVNPAFCELFGGAAEDWRGRDFGRPRATRPGERRRYEGETATRKGRRWTEWEESVLPDGRILSIGRDVSARREAQRGQSEDQPAARRAGRAFLAAVTHELRTPLNGVLGMAGLLEMSGLKPDQAEHVAAIRESGEHLFAMINDVLDAARLEAGDLELERSEVDCARMVRQVVELLWPKAFEKGLEIAAIVDPALPERVLGDEGRLRQILFNLAGAAVRRTAQGGVIVAARMISGGDNIVRIEFSVTDDGPAFSENARNAMVDPSILDEGEAAAAEHAGLGLVVARRLVAAMQGDLEVETLPGSGARMTARLDLPVAAPSPASVRLSGVSVIVASGSAALRRALCQQVQLLGARAIPAETPGAALHASLATPGSILLADAGWRMRMKEALAPASAAGLLLRPDQRDVIPKISAVGFDFYLMKPVRASSLAARLSGLQPEEEPDAGPGLPRIVQAATLNGVRILLAEDNRVNALLASTMLRGEGCVVDIVSNGEEAVAAARRAPYDLVLMDVRMPVKNGLAATREIRALGGAFADLPIVALTANAYAEDRQACLEAGMNDFATKPIDMDGVTALLQKWTRAEKQAKLA